MDVNAEQAFKDSLSSEAKYTLENSRALYERERILHMETKAQLEILKKEKAEFKDGFAPKFSSLLDDVKGEEIVGGKKLWREHLNLRIQWSKTQQQLQESHRKINVYATMNTNLKIKMDKLELEKRQKLTAFSNKITEVEQTLVAKKNQEIAELKKQAEDAGSEVQLLKDERKQTQAQYSKESEEKAALQLKLDKIKSDLEKMTDQKQRYCLKSKRYYDLYVEEQKKVARARENSTWHREQEDWRRKIQAMKKSMDELIEQNDSLLQGNRYLMESNRRLKEDSKRSTNPKDNVKKNSEKEILELKTKTCPQTNDGQSPRDPLAIRSSWRTPPKRENQKCFNAGCNSSQHFCHNSSRLPERGATNDRRYPAYRKPSRFRPKGGPRYTPARSQQPNGRLTSSPRKFSSDRRNFTGQSGQRQEAPMQNSWYQPPRSGDRKYVTNNPQKTDLNKLEGVDKYQNHSPEYGNGYGFRNRFRNRRSILK